MNQARAPRLHPGNLRFLAFTVLLLPAISSLSQEVQHLSIPVTGGMPGMPIMTGIERTTNGLKVMWDGPPGYYRLLQKMGLNEGNWQVVGSPTLERQATITQLHSNAFFRVSGPTPAYAGAQACIECHGDIHNSEMDTRHAKALDTLKKINQDKNPSCLPCHTVGYGLPSGFDEKNPNRAHLAGVQCESCHGPAANHAASEFDFTVRPRADIASTVCGGCHTGSHHPTYGEWTTSDHATVTRANMNANSCGRCHIGSARLAMLNGETPPQNDRNIGIVCISCHDPHGRHVFTNVLTGLVYTNQLRNPVSSTNDYFLTTSDVFATKYNPNINLCAQCHNHRGAAWTSNGSAPHHSPQYNMLLGTVGELASGTAKGQPSSHATKLDKQCVTCHMQTEEYVSEDHPAVTGHSFNVESFDTCRSCHPSPEMLTDFVQSSVSSQIQEIKAYLDIWAATRAPLELWTNYGTRSWEFTSPGSLSSGGPGPTASQQTNSIPANIRKARYNIYVVLYDGSYGVHNGRFAISLLENARTWVAQELEK
ncbi:MAG TPA: multiheme c-type cytochrome [Verrucomicrobiota bacterium]|nr:multiheme c-type cytochrome [Verrucomicrobiota bacterium]